MTTTVRMDRHQRQQQQGCMTTTVRMVKMTVRVDEDDGEDGWMTTLKVGDDNGESG